MKLSKTTIEIAKQIDLLTYLERHSPHEIIRITPRECCTRTHDSLRISNGGSGARNTNSIVKGTFM
jgi:hypothetical protein